MKLAWQSKVVLLLVLPVAGTELVLQTQWWAVQYSSVAIWTIGLSLLLALIVLRLRAASPAGAATGAAITATLMFSTVTFPYQPWFTALPPVLAVSVLASLSTHIGRGKKERFGTAEDRQGRSAAQVAANLGVAVLVSVELVQSWLSEHWLSALPSTSRPHTLHVLPSTVLVLCLAALAEAAADTVSSEIGQVFGRRPRMITTLRIADPGTDGAISLEGTLAGFAAACIVAAIGTWALRGNLAVGAFAVTGAIFGLIFDSLLGATLERSGWLNNDAVNFLSTAAASAFAFALVAFLPASIR